MGRRVLLIEPASSVSDNLAVDVVNLDEIRLGPCASLASL